jgi:hypothetical protein
VPAHPHPLSFLKIQFDAVEGWDKRQAASPILRGSTLIAMMQAANLREGNNVIAPTMRKGRKRVHRAEHGERQRVMLPDEEICARIFIERQQENPLPQSEACVE